MQVDRRFGDPLPRRVLLRRAPTLAVGPGEGHVAELGGCDARFLVWGEESGGGFSLVEHPIPPRSLCAPLHRHAGVDEYSFVLEGRMGALLGDEARTAASTPRR